MNRSIASLALIAIAASPTVRADVHLPALFADNMVLQQSADVPIWGHADAGETITLKADWAPDAAATATAGPDGKWKSKLKTAPAGGPYTLTITGKNTLSFKNVMLGEVWLCSGQSNMEWSVGPVVGGGVLNADAEIKAAQYPNLRLFSVKKARANDPKDNCEGTWQACSPETVRAFSGTAYFFGQRLHKDLNVPVGLIHSSWGGTEIELWLSEPAMRTIPDFAAAIDNTGDAKAKFESAHAAWEKTFHDADAGWNKWNDPALADKDWKPLPAYATWSTDDLKDFDGIAWFRGTFDAPQAWSGQTATLELGAIDDRDMTWLNGKLIGTTDGWNIPRSYVVAGDAVKTGVNRVVIRVHDTGGQGGFVAGPGQPCIVRGGEKLPIAGWKYRVSTPQSQIKPEPQLQPREHSTLYNAMIAPLVPFAIRGAIWYQGESNVSRAAQYRQAFPLLIKSWRETWGQGEFPFYYVQIAPFSGYNSNGKAAELRESQRLALSIPNAGMVVTTDVVSDLTDIHPPDKQEIGSRLAAWALAKTYGKSNVPFSGPLYRSMAIEGAKIRLTFDGGGALEARGGKLSHFTIAGADRKFVTAEAVIDGDTVVVSSPQVKQPAAVRFAWEDAPIPSFFNRDGLPASPFRTDDWPLETDGAKW